jgi:hypothetical protein
MTLDATYPMDVFDSLEKCVFFAHVHRQHHFFIKTRMVMFGLSKPHIQYG